jgi:hypothetical protein
MAKYLIEFVLLISAMQMSSAMAEVLRDPTMPAAQSGLVPVSQLPSVAPPPMLQSITLGTTAKYAMINGQTVMLGSAYEQWTLVKLTANEAILRSKDGATKVLVMGYPLKKSSQHDISNDAQKTRQPTQSSAANATRAAAIDTNDRLTERLNAQVRVPAETVWVKQ